MTGNAIHSTDRRTLDLRLLGPVEMRASGRIVDVGGPRQRCVLVALAVDVGRPILIDGLIYRVWGENPPAQVRQALYVYVARLRTILGTLGSDHDDHIRLVRRSRGYLLDVDPDRVDVHRFARLVDQSRSSGSDAQRAEKLRQALDLWRGTPLGDLSGDWAQQARLGWQRQHLDVVIAWAEAELRLGHAAALTGPLTALLADHPVEESVALMLMRALRATGHTTGALDCYAATRRLLVEKLGIEPGMELRRLHQAILRGDDGGGRGTVAPARVASSLDVPAQLPLNVADLVGRDGELARMDAMVTEAGTGAARRATCVLTGTAGIGKTTLAVRWAHRVADRFPDGQLYLNLRGFDGSRTVTPTEALQDLLTGLGVAADQLPVRVDALAALYRSRLAGRRMLVLLDNARDSEQVRPLMPGAPGCVVVVTSRNQLTSLVAVEGTDLITLDLLPTEGARELLTRRLGAGRIAAEPQAADEVIELCARLPLALAIVAARAVAHPDFPLASLRDELRASQGALDVLDAGDASTNVRTVLSWSYHALRDEAARLFRLLGLHTGVDITVSTAASLSGIPVDSTRLHLTELVRANMITHHLPGRYLLHDLLRMYAAELTESIDPPADRQTARHRLFDHYLHTARAATLLLSPQREPPVLAPALPGVTVESLSDSRSASVWYRAECNALAAAVRSAASNGFDSHTWQLGWTLRLPLTRGMYRHDEAALQELALDAARRCGDGGGQAHIHRGLARPAIQQARFADAERHLRAALALDVELDNTVGRADTLLGFGLLHGRQGDFGEALRRVEEALRLYRDAGHRAGEMESFNAVAWCFVNLDRHEEAFGLAQEALRYHQARGDQHAQAHTWDTLGTCHHSAGDDRQAIACYQRAVALFQETGNTFFEAESLARLGDMYQGQGKSETARRHWRRGYDLVAEIDRPEAKNLRELLRQRQLDQTTALATR